MDNPRSPAESAQRTSESEAQADLAPETHNAEQDDEDAQAQTLADEALGRRPEFEGPETERAGLEDETTNAPDLVDRMNQMVSSGRLDLGAFRGERNDDDEDGYLGEEGREDDFPRGID